MGGEQYLESGCNLENWRDLLLDWKWVKKKKERRYKNDSEALAWVTRSGVYTDWGGEEKRVVGVGQELDFDIVNISFC